MNKKGDITYIIVIVLVSLISFGVIVTYFLQTNDIISSSFDDVQCNTLMKFKGSDIYEITDFFYQINTKCKVDQIAIDDSYSTGQFYNKMADTSVSCFDRYGKGEYDFLEKYNANGNWCFLCAKVDIKERSDNFEDFFNFITWTKNNNVNQTTSYYDYTNYVYFDPSDENLKKVDELNFEVNEIVNQVLGETPEFEELSLYLLDEYQTLIDYQLKNFETEDTYYVTYRFTRVDKDTQEQLNDIMIDARNAVIGGVVASIGAEMLIGATVGAGIGQACNFVPVVGGIVCGTVGGVLGGIAGAIKGTISTAKGMRSVIKLQNTLQKIKSLKYFSKNNDNFIQEELLEVTLKTGGRYNFPKDLKLREITYNELDQVADLMKLENKLPDEIANIEELSKIMKSKDIQKLGDINKVTNSEIAYLQKLSSSTPNVNIEGVKSAERLKQLEEMKPYMQSIVKDLKSNQILNLEQKTTITDYAKLYLVLVGIGVGIAYEDNLDDSRQYVDIMTKEEFYRQCGFPPEVTATN